MMLKKVLRLLRFIEENRNLFIYHVLTCMGILSTLITIVVAFNQDFFQGKIYLLYVLFVVSVGYAILRVFPCEEVTIEFIKRRTINVKFGNIWDVKKGIVVVPVNNYLDTQVDDVIISSRSLHGQFVKVFKKKYPERDLDAAINGAIRKDGINPIGKQHDRKNVIGHVEKYELGQVIRLMNDDGLQYYLVVSTEFDEDNHIIKQPERFSFMLLNMIKNIEKWNSGIPVNLPVIGSGQMGLELSEQEILLHIMQCFNFADKYVALGGTTIWVYNGDKDRVSLNHLKHQLNDA